ncbi:MAG: hypothetical protein ABW352_15440 [Polyangiales bacterium]
MAVAIRCVLCLLTLLAVGCGEDADDDADADSAVPLDASVARPTRYETTLVPASSRDASVFIAIPHEVSLLDVDGNPVQPPVEILSGEDGKIRFDLPRSAVSIYVVGVGPAEDASSTSDTVLLNVDWTVEDSLLRITTRAGLEFFAGMAGVEARADRAALTGQVYWTRNGVRQGTVGCAQLFIDGLRVPDESQAQRYASNGSLVLPEVRSATTRDGFFYFGNIRIGLHMLRVSFDGGQSYVAMAAFTVARPRSGARSPSKSILYQIGVEVEANVDPTPATCPL